MAILDFIFPKRCVRCMKFGSYVCGRCASHVHPVLENEMICPMCEKPAIDGCTHPKCHTRYGLDGLYSFFHYHNTTRFMVKALKYRAVYDIAGMCGNFIPAWSYTLFRKISGHQVQNAVCIPIPLFSLREKQRGFNQSEILGRFVSQKLHIPIAADILYRTKYTVPQVEMKDRKDRLQNMKDVFAISKDAQSMPRAMILFDDVWTTGATMRAAANVLKRHGVQTVWAMTFAR